MRASVGPVRREVHRKQLEVGSWAGVQSLLHTKSGDNGNQGSLLGLPGTMLRALISSTPHSGAMCRLREPGGFGATPNVRVGLVLVQSFAASTRRKPSSREKEL